MKTVMGVSIDKFIDGDIEPLVMTISGDIVLAREVSMFMNNPHEWDIRRCVHNHLNDGKIVISTHITLYDKYSELRLKSYLHYKLYSEIYVDDSELVKELLYRQLSPYAV